ncbi:MFS transporter [Nostocoides australiense]|nr:MFS transporter [Tetrasphaera australiensis]
MLRRLGFPDFSHHKALVTGVGIDALGSGVFMPVSILYFLMTTEVGKAQVGLAMSIAAALAVPFVLAVGGLVDRHGAKTIILAGNVLQAVAFVGYLWAQDFWTIVAVQALASLGQSAFWGAYSPLVAASTPPDQREVWFGFLGALRNVGFAIGGLASGIVVTIGTSAAYHAVVLVNAFSYILAFAALAKVPGGRAASDGPQDADAPARGGWGVLARDGRYLGLVGANAAYALCTVSLNIAIPVYAIDVLKLPGWVSGALFVVNTLMVGFGQGLIVRRMDGHRRHQIVILGFVLYAAGFLALAASGTLPVALATAAIPVSVAIYTLGELLGGPPLSAAAVDGAPERLRGRYLSAYQLSWVASGIIAPALYLALLAHDRFSVWATLIGIAALGCVGLRALAPRMPAVSAVVTSAQVTHA